MNLTFRTTPKETDSQHVKDITESTGFFYDFEVEVAVELVDDWLSDGDASGYYFVFADIDGQTVGYSCFGPIACTKSSHDLYWIVTHNDYRGKGIGKQLLEETYKHARAMGCTGLYAETSGREQYKPTQHFYDNNNFILEAILKDFYDIGDDKLVYVKKL